MMIDGERDLRGIAGALGRSEFEVAKIAYGLVSTTVVELRAPSRPSVATIAAMAGPDEALTHARECLNAGRNEEALTGARVVLNADPGSTQARLVAARALMRLGRHHDAVDELRRAVQSDPLTPAVHLDLGFAATRVGDFANARASWEHFLRLAPGAVEGKRVRTALETMTRLVHLLEAHSDD
jgi:cytochrome c-type biogenesis protein CcmH/NrfG